MKISSLIFGLLVQAAVSDTNFNACCEVDPNSVAPVVRAGWCRQQQNSCPELCVNGQTSANYCDAVTLKWTCTCLTGFSPDMSDYAQTLPSLQCLEWRTQCLQAHPNDARGQNFCTSFQCGEKNASTVDNQISTSTFKTFATTSPLYTTGSSAVIVVATPASSPSFRSGEAFGSARPSGLNRAAVAGVAVGAIAFLVFALLLLCVYRKRRGRKRLVQNTETDNAGTPALERTKEKANFYFAKNMSERSNGSQSEKPMSFLVDRKSKYPTSTVT